MAILGIVALEDSFDRVRGAFMRRTDMWERAEKSSVGGSFSKIFGRIALVLGVTSGLLALPGQVADDLYLLRGANQHPGVSSTSLDHVPPSIEPKPDEDVPPSLPPPP